MGVLFDSLWQMVYTGVMSPYLFTYLGGKVRQSAVLVRLFSENKPTDMLYVEPFVGAGSTLLGMSGPRVGFDVNRDLVAYWHALQNGWLPPEHVTEDTYRDCQANPQAYAPHLRAFIAFGCSYGGKYWGGYARGGGRDFPHERYRSTLKAVPAVKGVSIGQSSYLDLEFENAFIYCDPPYQTTSRYHGTAEFDHVLFWETMRTWAAKNIVYVTEYQAPAWAQCVHSFQRYSALSNTSSTTNNRVENLYRILA